MVPFHQFLRTNAAGQKLAGRLDVGGVRMGILQRVMSCEASYAPISLCVFLSLSLSQTKMRTILFFFFPNITLLTHATFG